MNLIYSLDITMCIIKEMLVPALVGAEIFHRNAIKDSLRSIYNPDINTLHLVSGVEMALWDLEGKALGCSISRLLGGKVRDRIPAAYAFGYLDAVSYTHLGIIFTSLISGALSSRPLKAPKPTQPPITIMAIREMKMMRIKETCAFFPIIVEREESELRF